MKLYWRVKIDGKWTYKAAEVEKAGHRKKAMYYLVRELKE
tara:strand:+ start:31 stop:150 length:120 start_codon:yes stop_codon:yes gene_type:complete